MWGGNAAASGSSHRSTRTVVNATAAVPHVNSSLQVSFLMRSGGIDSLSSEMIHLCSLCSQYMLNKTNMLVSPRSLGFYLSSGKIFISVISSQTCRLCYHVLSFSSCLVFPLAFQKWMFPSLQICCYSLSALPLVKKSTWHTCSQHMAEVATA